MTPSPKQTAPGEVKCIGSLACSDGGVNCAVHECDDFDCDCPTLPAPTPEAAGTPDVAAIMAEATGLDERVAASIVRAPAQAPTQERVFLDCCGRMDDEGHAAACKGPLASTLAVKNAELASLRAELKQADAQIAGWNAKAADFAARLKAILAPDLLEAWTLETALAAAASMRTKLEEAEKREAGGHDAAAVVAYAAREIERVERNEKVTREGWRAEKARADAAEKERDAKDAKITSLRAALTEAVDTTFDEEATWLAEANYGPLPPPADLREHAASLRAKAEAWRKVLTDSEVSNAR